MLSSCLVTVKRYDDKFLEEPAKGLGAGLPKPSGNDDNATTVVGVYEILPTNCIRKVYYQRKKLAGGMSTPRPIIPYIIRGRVVEAAIARILFAHTGTTALERHKRYERARIVCHTDLSDCRTIIEIKDTNTGRRLIAEDIHFKGYLMQVLYYMVIAEKEEANF